MSIAKTVKALNGLGMDEGMFDADVWMDAHPGYAQLDRKAVYRRARQISNGAGMYIGWTKAGGMAVTGLAMRMAAVAELEQMGKVGLTRYTLNARERTAAEALEAARNQPKFEIYDAVLAAFKSRGGSFDAWAERSGFYERKARHAVRHPEWKGAEYTRIREALRAALVEMGVEIHV